MPFVSVASAERSLMRFYFDHLEPIEIAFKKRKRMARLGIEDLDQLRFGEVDLRPAGGECVPVCSEIVEAHREYLLKYLSLSGAVGNKRPWRAVPFVIELDRYPDFASYANRLKRKSKSGVLQEIGKARRQGFCCRPFDRAAYPLELFDIETSKRFRSGRPVVAAFLRPRPRRIGAFPRPEPQTAPCRLHWYCDWGVFAAGGADNQSDAVLVGYIFLKRVGNIARVTAIMGHGAYLPAGIMKLLFAEVMKWLLDRDDERVCGIRYLHYGAIEHGGDGLVAWKRRFRFEPLLLSWQSPAAVREANKFN